MNIHHNTSLRSILENDSIFSTSKAHIRSCSDKGAKLWLVIKPSIHSFHITHFIFTLVLHFHLYVIQPSTSNLLMCENEHGLNTSSTHLARCPFGGQRIATHDTIQDVIYVFFRESRHVVWRERWYALMSKSFIMN
jgi:hypothetical protein